MALYVIVRRKAQLPVIRHLLPVPVARYPFRIAGIGKLARVPGDG
jgi:hypothetical protein